MTKKLMCFIGAVCIACTMSGVAHAYINRENATLRIMNKAAGKVYTIDVPVNQETQFEKLHILVRACLQTDPFDAENFFAFTEISKSDENKIFSNWLNANEPGDNPVQNADYDVWLVHCQ